MEAPSENSHANRRQEDVLTVKKPKTATSRRKAILVLGMHRSGTSAISRVVNLLGATAPKNLMPGTPDNPKGYWESSRIYELHTQFLDSMGSHWHDWRSIDPDQLENSNAQQFKAKLKGIIKAEYANSPLIFIKDPRICRLLPFWLTALKELNIDPLAIVALRNPLEIGLSLHRRYGIALSKSYLLWLRHALEAEYFSRQLPRMFVQYDKMLSNWRAHLFPDITNVGVAWPELTQSTKLEIDRFLSLELRHQNATISDLAAHPDVTSWVVRTYDALLELAEDDQNPVLFRKLDAIRAIFDEACRSFGDILQDEEEQRVRIAELENHLRQRDTVVAHMSDEQQRRDAVVAKLSDEQHELRTMVEILNAELELIRTSVSWRLTKPIRIAGSAFSRLARQEPRTGTANRQSSVGTRSEASHRHLHFVNSRALLRHPFSSASGRPIANISNGTLSHSQINGRT